MLIEYTVAVCFAELLQHKFAKPFVYEIICVNENNKVSLCMIYGGVSRYSGPTVFLMNDGYSFIAQSPFIQHRTATVCRPIIHENNLKVFIGLTADG